MSSHAVLSSHLTTLMKDVSEALKFDRQDKNEDAYKKYLECVLRVSTGLLKTLYADEGHVFVTKDVVKMVKLGQQCMDRVASIVNGRLEKSRESKVQAPTSLPISTGPGSYRSLSQTTPTTPGSRETTPLSPNKPISMIDKSSPVQKVITSDSFSSSTKKLGPMEMAIRNNQYLLIDLRKRQAKAKNKSASTNLSLTLQRRMAENLAIARAQEEALAKKMRERQQRLEEQAQRRFHTPVGLSEEEQQQRQVYKKALEFEQENLWMMELRRKFEESPSDLYVISELVTAILSCDAHPLTIELQQHQRNLLDKLVPIVEKNLNKLENLKVPLPKDVYEQSNIKDLLSSLRKVKSATKLSQSESVLESVDEADSTYGSCISHDICDQSKESGRTIDSSNNSLEDKVEKERGEIKSSVFKKAADNNDIEGKGSVIKQTRDFGDRDLADVSLEIKNDLEKAITDGTKLKIRLEEENQRLKMFSRQATEEYEKYNQENMDDLFDDDDDSDTEVDISNVGGESVANEKEADGNKTSSNDRKSIETSSKLTENLDVEEAEKSKEIRSPRGLRKNPSFENLDDKIALLKNEACHRHLKGITEDVLTSVEQLQVLFVIVFEQLDSADGRDQCNVLLERYFFKPVWNYLLALFR
ncbi:VPS9 domain-containing protein 1-like [Ruditapes philippinarum]|uniref:VPS9 domain-containing protein 1-like n=1 Tax=Ruditapes philippinarum TaxID=129788 RepID=UPI00295BA902|nr:VPS9 domain-containing protein 1-like [Ruditapes philippinarum]